MLTHQQWIWAILETSKRIFEKEVNRDLNGVGFVSKEDEIDKIVKYDPLKRQAYINDFEINLQHPNDEKIEKGEFKDNKNKLL